MSWKLRELEQRLEWLKEEEHVDTAGNLSVISNYPEPPGHEEWIQHRRELFAEERAWIEAEIQKERERTTDPSASSRASRILEALHALHAKAE